MLTGYFRTENPDDVEVCIDMDKQLDTIVQLLEFKDEQGNSFSSILKDISRQLKKLMSLDDRRSSESKDTKDTKEYEIEEEKEFQDCEFDIQEEGKPKRSRLF